MKNKTSNTRLSYFSTPRIHGNVLAWVKPASAPEKGKRVIETILRWEDDGGQILDSGSAPDPANAGTDGKRANK
jgi:hypothetical protein